MPTTRLRRRVGTRQGFTLLEVLMVVAVIGILVAIIIPALGGAQTSAKRAKTRVQFSQWSAAIEQFRQEYGYYPAFQASGTGAFTDGLVNSDEKSRRFIETLTGRRVDGTALVSGDPGLLAGNTKRIAFCSLGGDDVSSGGRIQDAFGNVQIAVIMDRNLDGSIDVTAAGADYNSTAPPTTITSIDARSVAVTFPSSNRIRAGVAFYSAGDGQTAVTSW
jgi:prepilin-type N-terminal cleavage/methylation domain-containing protein